MNKNLVDSASYLIVVSFFSLVVTRIFFLHSPTILHKLYVYFFTFFLCFARVNLCVFQVLYLVLFSVRLFLSRIQIKRCKGGFDNTSYVNTYVFYFVLTLFQITVLICINKLKEINREYK